MPTTKQKIAFKEVLNGSTITKAMKKAGYSPTTASTTGKLTNTKGWEELMELHLPDKLLAKKHREGLNATKKEPQIIDRDLKGAPVYEYVSEVDFSTRHKYLDSAYKLKGRYATSDINVSNKTLVINISKEAALKYDITPSPSENTL